MAVALEYFINWKSFCSALDDDEEEAESLGSDSDDSVVLSRRKGGPVRRSGRYSNRMTKWDREFSQCLFLFFSPF